MALPSGYTPLEYIESTGSQYVDTGFAPGYMSGYRIDFQLTTASSSDLTLMGSLNPNICFLGGNGQFEYAYKSGTGASGSFGANDTKRHVWSLNFRNDQKAILDQTSKVLAAMSENNAKTAYIFASHYDNPVVYGQISARVFRVEMSNGADLVRDFIPCTNPSGEAGLWDNVNGVFYGNAGTGAFVAGPVVVPPDPPEPPGPYEPPDYIARTQAYMNALRQPFQKLCRLRFLQPDGSTAFSLDNNPRNQRSGAFIADGSIATNLQNGKRRTATVMLSNLDGSFDYNVNTVWFGTEIAIDEGLILPDGEEYYIQQGVFLIENPTESVRPGDRVVTYNLVDKWANLDGTLFGNLESTYEVPSGTNIFQPINAILALDKGNGQPVDRVTPIYTEYYNSKSQALPDGSTAAITNAPYTLRVDSDNGTYADVILGLAGMVNAWIGYDQTGALRIDPSQDDILDTNKPVLWQFSMDRVTFLGADYTVKNTEVYNDYIVIGELLDDNSQPAGRATNLDPRSDTNVQTIGRKTFRMSAPGFATDQQCQDLAVWKLKRSSALQKAITISCSQIFHIEENSLVSIVRTDKPGSPVERHLVMGFTRPLVSTGEMQINAVSVQDFVTATVTSWPE